ncbi:DUF4339 domain-containing protein [Vibrio rumoiensis]|uniref:DUF4339 domain-containing protein n=1 Tax=Vibrio rumoiensis TaxID=76258 RepID=UPI003AA9938C
MNHDIWFYEKQGERLGGHSMDELQALITRGEITQDTLVWKQGMSTWLKAAESELARYLPPPLNMPPPLPNAAEEATEALKNVNSHHTTKTDDVKAETLIPVSHWRVWLLALSPLIGCVVVSFVAAVLNDGHEAKMLRDIASNYFVYFPIWIATVLLAWLLDIRYLKAKGINHKDFKMHGFIVSYFYARLNKNKLYTVIVSCVFGFSILVFMSLSESESDTSDYASATPSTQEVIRGVGSAEQLANYLDRVNPEPDETGRARVEDIGRGMFRVSYSYFCGSGGCFPYTYYAQDGDGLICKLDASNEKEAKKAFCEGKSFSVF